MSRRSIPLQSYRKTTWTCWALLLVCLAVAWWALFRFGGVIGTIIAVIFLAGGCASAVCAAAGELVQRRQRRSERGERDLFLELNRARAPGAIQSGPVPGRALLRRWLVRQLCGHDLLAGDWVEVRPWHEIRATLDAQGCLEQLPFMPEMLAACGQRARVFRCMHRLFDYRKSRRMRHMDRAVLLVGTICSGARHGHCDAGCHTIWKTAWLRRITNNDVASSTFASSTFDRESPSNRDISVIEFGSQGPRYTCQLTQLQAASAPIEGRPIADVLLPIVTGNVAPPAFIVGWLTHWFDELQQLRGGVGFPEFEKATHVDSNAADIRLHAGESVIVRMPQDIRSTLDDKLQHRGMWFEPDMLKHCAHRYRVQSEVTRLIDIVSGEMRSMKTPGYILEDVHFSGERQLFNAQYEPLFWRAAWLRRDCSTRAKHENDRDVH